MIDFRSSSIQLPAGYNRDLKNEYIRVALVTQTIGTSGRYYSPYKFQTDHRNSKVPDENPIFIPVRAVGRSGSNLKYISSSMIRVKTTTNFPFPLFVKTSTRFD